MRVLCVVQRLLMDLRRIPSACSVQLVLFSHSFGWSCNMGADFTAVVAHLPWDTCSIHMLLYIFLELVVSRI